MFHKTRGSFFINLGIALAVILILVSLSIPSITATRRFLVRTELEKLYSLFYYMQQRAIAQDQDQELTFDLQQNSLSAQTIQQKLPPSIRFGFIAGAQGPPSQPKKTIAAAVTFKNNKVFFYADGTMSSGTVYLVDTECKYMYALTSPISQISFVRMYRYNNGSWILLK